MYVCEKKTPRNVVPLSICCNLLVSLPREIKCRRFVFDSDWY